jgi:serine/threonine-protein kinase
MVVPPESAKVIARRAELLERAIIDANVAQARGATQSGSEDMILGKYKIVRKLSTGGMAEVFLANQVGIGGFEKPVALKRIKHQHERRRQAVELFLNEAKIAARLMHPNIVQVLDVGEVGGALYLAMEYVHGRDLRDVMKLLNAKSTTIPLGETCYIVREVAQALQYAYWSSDMAGEQLSVVHRDVSPHNILLGYDGTVKLLDFGVALSSVTEYDNRIIVGKWPYMPPEATLDSKVDHRSDLFSLGAVLYFLCTGYPPFTGSSEAEFARKIRAGAFRPVREVAPEVPERLAALIEKLLAANPERRFQRAQDIVSELDEIMREHGMESSGQAIAELLSNLFPTGGGDERDVMRFVRVHDDPEQDDGDGATTQRNDRRSHSPSSLTPSARTSQALVDVSASFQRTSASPLRSLSQQHDVPKPAGAASKPVSVVNVVLFLVIVAVAAAFAYFVVSSY